MSGPFGAVRVDVYAADGTTKLGAGPLSAIMQCRYSEAVDEMGAFSFVCPGDHPTSAQIDDLRYVRIYVGGEGYVFQGQITNFETEITAEGRRRMTVNGWSSVFELVRKKTGYGFQIIDETMNDAVDALLDGTGWTRGTVDSAVVESYELEFNGATRLEALRKLAEVQGFILRFDSRTRVVDMGAMGTNPNGLRFTGMEGPVSPSFMANVTTVIPIGDIRVVSESNEVRNKVRIIGQMEGIDGDVLTLANSDIDSPYTRQSEVQPDGRTVYYLADATSIAAHGTFEEDLQVDEIRILGTSDAHRTSAANSLYGVAATYLARHKDPLKNYALRPVGLRHIAEGSDLFDIGDKYPVFFRGWREERTQEGKQRRVWVEVHADLWLMARERTIDSSGKRTWQLGLSTTTREIPTESAAVAQVLNNVKSSLAARLPILTWGGNPPVGRLTPSGVQIKTAVQGADSTIRSLAHMSPDFEETWAQRYGDYDDGDETFTLTEKIFQQPGDTWYEWEIWNSAPGIESRMRLFDTDGANFAANRMLISLVGESTELGGLHKKADGKWVWMLRNATGQLEEVGKGMELKVKPTDQSVNGTTLTNETALAIPIGANETIQFEGVIFQTGSTWKLAVTGPSGSDGYFMQERPGQSASMNSLGNAITSLSADEPRYISGAVVNGATSGNITLQFAEQSAVGGTTMQAGSYVKWQVE